MIVLGAGLSGLLAGALDRRAQLIEAQPNLPHNHHAVLRFRDDKISRALNIPFRRVRVLKGVATAGGVRTEVTPADANRYARKVTGSVTARSILDLRPVDRYIAPPDLIPQLAELCAGRITLKSPVDAESLRKMDRPLISTIPLPAMLKLLGVEDLDLKFDRAPIRVMKLTVRGADVFQTIYFPGEDTPVYRATITGSDMAVEMTEDGALTQYALEAVLAAFGLELHHAEVTKTHRQNFGKILPLPDNERKALLLRLSVDHGVYSLGRFACWRNILLDDVYEDFFRVRNMMTLNQYDLIRRIT